MPDALIAVAFAFLGGLSRYHAPPVTKEEVFNALSCAVWKTTHELEEEIFAARGISIWKSFFRSAYASIQMHAFDLKKEGLAEYRDRHGSKLIEFRLSLDGNARRREKEIKVAIQWMLAPTPT